VKLPSECVTGLRVDTNSRNWIFGMESIDDLEVWTKVISENCIFATNFSEKRDSLSKERCGSFESRGSRGWSSVKKSFGGVISKTMGLSRGLQDADVFTFKDDKIIQVNRPDRTNKEDTGSESDWKTGDNLLDLDTAICMPLEGLTPPPYKAPLKSAPFPKKTSTSVSTNSDAAALVKSASVSKKASSTVSTNSNGPEMQWYSSFNDITPGERGKVSSIKELKFGEDPLTADVKNELRSPAHARNSSEPLLFSTVGAIGGVRRLWERTKSPYKFKPVD